MSADRPIAAIDIGTNSVHLVIARPVEGGSPEVITREKAPVRLDCLHELERAQGVPGEERQNAGLIRRTPGFQLEETVKGSGPAIPDRHRCLRSPGRIYPHLIPRLDARGEKPDVEIFKHEGRSQVRGRIE